MISSSGFDLHADLQTPHVAGQWCRTISTNGLSGKQRPCVFASAHDCGPCLLKTKRTPILSSGAELHPEQVFVVLSYKHPGSVKHALGVFAAQASPPVIVVAEVEDVVVVVEVVDVSVVVLVSVAVVDDAVVVVPVVVLVSVAVVVVDVDVVEVVQLPQRTGQPFLKAAPSASSISQNSVGNLLQ